MSLGEWREVWAAPRRRLPAVALIPLFLKSQRTYGIPSGGTDNITSHLLSDSFSMTSYETDWLKKCPVCKQGPLSAPEEKKIFGFLPGGKFCKCPKCGASFNKKSSGARLTSVQNKDNPIWRQYGHNNLTAREWLNIANGGMSDQVFVKSSEFKSWLEQLKQGKIPATLLALPISLTDYEKPLLNLNNISLLEPRIETTGYYGGVNYQPNGKDFGAQGGEFKTKQEEVITNIDTGTLSLTNNRLVFLGGQHSINCGLNEIVDWSYFNDGIEIARTDQEIKQSFTGFNKTMVSIVVDSNSYFARFTGEMFVAIWNSMFYEPEKEKNSDSKENEQSKPNNSSNESTENRDKRIDEKQASSKHSTSKKRKSHMPGKQEFKGKGDSVVKNFQLGEGLATFSFQNEDDTNWFFQVSLLNSQGENLGYLLNESNGKDYKGQTAIHVPADGDYIMNVKSRGKWIINIEQ
ncbi:MAG: hypothetical protein M1455_11130 [Actinobacteria bacterium]|nr:hypothetical protein [Actinomycetota bacterium]